MMSFAVLALVKATLVCGVAFLFSRRCRRARASIRHLLFALAFIALVAVLVAGTMFPTVTVTMPATATVRAPQGRDTAAAVLSSAGSEHSESSPTSVSQETARGALGLPDEQPVKDGVRSVLVPSVGLGRVATIAIGSRAGV